MSESRTVELAELTYALEEKRDRMASRRFYIGGLLYGGIALFLSWYMPYKQSLISQHYAEAQLEKSDQQIVNATLLEVSEQPLEIALQKINALLELVGFSTETVSELQSRKTQIERAIAAKEEERLAATRQQRAEHERQAALAAARVDEARLAEAEAEKQQQIKLRAQNLKTRTLKEVNQQWLIGKQRNQQGVLY